MPGFTEQLTQFLSIPVASTMPSNQGSGAGNQATIGPIDMSHFRRVLAHVMLGAAGTSANVQAFFQTSNVSGSGFANVTNGQTLTLSTANTEGTIEIRADQLPTNNRYLQLITLVNTNPANTAATVWGGQASYSPASTNYDYSGLAANRLVT